MSAPGPSWKNPGGSSSGPSSSRKNWQPGKPTPKGPKKTGGSYKKKVFAAALSGGLLIGVIVVVLFLIKPLRKPHLAVISPELAASTVAPANPAGRGARDLHETFKKSEGGPVTSDKGLDQEDLTRDNWSKNIDWSGKPPVIVYLSGPGGADKNGPYMWLVPKDATLRDREKHRLGIKDVLNVLKDLPEKKQKLLVLDPTSDAADWGRGELHPDFGRQLRALNAQIAAIPNLVVICSADDDQQSWTSDVLRNTAFGHLFKEIMRGVGAEPGARITAAHLHKSLADQVEKWAQANRNVMQRPFLLPSEDPDDAKNGFKRAEKIELVSVGPNGATATPAPTGGTGPETLESYWKDGPWTATPAPWVSAPNQWHQYLDLLLQTERNARLNAEVAPSATSRLTRIATEMSSPPWPAPSCVPYSLPAAKGLGITRAPLPIDTLEAVWKDSRPSEEWNRRTADRPGGRAADDVRLSGAELLLKVLTGERALTLPDEAARARAADLLKHIDGSSPRPIETHVLMTMREHLGATRSPALVRTAIDAQIEAERSAWYIGNGTNYPYAEQVSRWLGRELEAVDVMRRDGIDLVFSDSPSDATTASSKLLAALGGYKKLNERATQLGSAFAVRDRIFGELPYYARWAASRRVAAAEVKESLDLIESIAGKTHKLAAVLESSDVGRFAEACALAEELSRTGATPGEFTRLCTIFGAQRDRLRDSTSTTPAEWHEIDAILRVPFIEWDVRKRLLERSRQISVELASRADATGAKAEPAQPQELAQRQGRMAMAVLGEPQFGLPRPGPTWQQLVQLARDPSGSWRDSIAQVGEASAHTIVAIAGAGKQAADDGVLDLGDNAAEQKLARAAHLARLADSSAELTGRGPAFLERRYWTHRLLIERATRVALDGWDTLDKQQTRTYARQAADEYLKSADAILFAGEANVDPAQRERRRKKIIAAETTLPAPAFLFDASPSKLYLTNRPAETVNCQVRPKDKDGTGHPVLRVSAVSGPLGSNVSKIGEYASADVAKSIPIPLQVAKAADGAKGEAHFQLLYRGHREEKTVEAIYAGAPTYEWIYNAPVGRPASIAVRAADELRKGSVVILFDWSSSMTEKTPSGKSRYIEAAEGVQKLLARLPQGTRVCVMRFGQTDKVDPIILKPTTWENPVVQSQKVYEEITKTAPVGWTPLSEAICDVCRTWPFDAALDQSNLIVVTDGVEETQAGGKAPPLEPGKRVVTMLNELRDDIGLHMMLFNVDAATYRTAHDQFSPILEFRKEGRTVPKIWPERAADGKQSEALDTADQLTNILLEAMLPRVIVRKADGELNEQMPLSVPYGQRGDRGWRWLRRVGGVKADVYDVLLPRSRQQVQLDPGDRLILDLRPGAGGKPELSLPSFVTARQMANVPQASNGGVSMTASGNFLRSEGSSYDLELTSTLERPQTAREKLYREYPRFVWFDVTGIEAGATTHQQVRIENLLDRWAPAWKVTARDWSTDVSGARRPRIDGYWLERDDPESITIDFNTVKTADRDLKQRELRVGDSRVFNLELRVGADDLTVSFEHEKNKEVYVRAVFQGERTTQRQTLSEHHTFFGKANKYEARFFPVRQEDQDRKLTLYFSTVNRMKAESKRVTIELPTTPTNRAPDDVIEEEKLQSK